MSKSKAKKSKYKTDTERAERSKIPRIGPPLFFSHPALRRESQREDSVELHLGKTKFKLLAIVSIGLLPGSGFIHMFPTKDQIDEIVAYLLDLKNKL